MTIQNHACTRCGWIDEIVNNHDYNNSISMELHLTFPPDHLFKLSKIIEELHNLKRDLK